MLMSKKVDQMKSRRIAPCPSLQCQAKECDFIIPCLAQKVFKMNVPLEHPSFFLVFTNLCNCHNCIVLMRTFHLQAVAIFNNPFSSLVSELVSKLNEIFSVFGLGSMLFTVSKQHLSRRYAIYSYYIFLGASRYEPGMAWWKV